MPLAATALKAITVLLATISVLSIVNLWLTGRAMRENPGLGITNEHYLNQHRWSFNSLVAATFAAIVMVEGVGRFLLHGIAYTWLFWVHLIFFAIPFAVLLVIIRFWANGSQDKFRHRKLVYWCIGEGAVTSILGTFLVLQVF